MTKHIPYGRQDINEADIDAVVEVLRSDYLTQGPAVERFEKELASFCGSRHAVAACNATAALHLGAAALGLGPGDRLWTSPITFVASANCARYCGADVDFVDIDGSTYNMSPLALKEKLSRAKRDGKMPKVIVPVHLSGQPCAMEEIHSLAKENGISVMEDASHAVGATYKNSMVGSGAFSDLTVFSFHPVKIITSGEGGALLANDQELDERIRLLRSHGITRDEGKMTHASHGPWYYQQIDLGWNYRLTDLQAALGSAQLRRIPQFLAKRRKIAETYAKLLSELPVTLPWQSPDGDSSYHLYLIRLRLSEIRRTHRQVFEYMRSKGIGVNVHYIPVHLQPYYRALGFREGMFPESERYYDESISLPMYPGLSESDILAVVGALREAIS